MIDRLIAIVANRSRYNQVRFIFMVERSRRNHVRARKKNWLQP